MNALLERLRFLWPGLVSILLAAVLYSPIFELDYVWDDNALFVDNPNLRTGDIEWAKLTQPILPGTSYVRPLVIWSFMAEFRYLGLSPALSHAISYSIYLLNVFLVLILAYTHFVRRGLARAEIRAAIAALVYAIHPALIESTVWVSGRFDLMATFFVLLALVLDLHLKSAWPRALTVGTAFALSLGSKEVAAVLPILLVIQRLALEPATGSVSAQVVSLLKEHRRTVLTCAAAVLLYLMARADTLGRLAPPTTVGESLTSTGAHLAFVLQTLFFYIEQSFMPLAGTSMPIHTAHPERVFNVPELFQALAAMVVLALILFAAFRRSHAGLMLLSAVICLIPVLNIVPLPLADNIGCDRFLTLPIAFVAACIAGLPVQYWNRHFRLSKFLAATVLGVWGTMAIANVHATIPLWSNDLTLWGWLYNEPNASSNARPRYTAAALRMGRYDLAREVFDEQLREGPLEATQQMHFGFLLSMTGEPEEGIKYIQGAMSVFPKVPYATASTGRANSGVSAYLRERIGFGHNALAESKLVLRDAPGALSSVDEALRYRPVSPHIILVRSLALEALGRQTEANIEYQKALDLSHPSAQKSLMQRRERFRMQWAAGKDHAKTDHLQ